MQQQIYKVDKARKDIDYLLQQNKNLVYYMLANMGQLTNQDAESAAWEALWDAVETFDVFSKVQFSSYACVVLRNAINNILRKQMSEGEHQRYVLDQSSLLFSMVADNADHEPEQANVVSLFNTYIATKNGLVKNVMLYWYSNDFDTTACNIAEACSCTPSYVCRVQRDFRAYLSSKLKRQ